MGHRKLIFWTLLVGGFLAAWAWFLATSIILLQR